MNFIMSGHRGLIGKELVKRLEKEGNKFMLGIDLRDKERKLDVRNINKTEITSDIKENTNIFFHLASNCKVNKCINNPDWSFENVEGVFQALEFCRKNDIKRFVYFSSSRVLSPERNSYTASKLYGEEMCKAYKKCYGIDYIMIRPSTVYGPGEDPTNRLMNIWLNKALKNEDLEIFGDKEKTLDFTYINDFIEAIMLAFNEWDSEKEYDIACGKGIKLYDVAKEIIKQTNSSSQIIFKEPEKEQPQRVEVDISEIQKLGFQPETEISEGIKKCVEYFEN